MSKDGSWTVLGIMEVLLNKYNIWRARPYTAKALHHQANKGSTSNIPVLSLISAIKIF